MESCGDAGTVCTPTDVAEPDTIRCFRGELGHHRSHWRENVWPLRVDVTILLVRCSSLDRSPHRSYHSTACFSLAYSGLKVPI